MATTVTLVVLKHQQKENGTFPVKIRITHERKSAYIPLNKYLKRTDLDKKFNIIKETTSMRDEQVKYEKVIESMGSDVYNYDVKGLVEKLTEAINPKTDNINFATFFYNYYTEMKKVGRSSYENYQAAYNHLVNFGGVDLNFRQITSSFLKLLEKYMIKQGVGMSGISKYMACIRAVFNEGRKEYNDEDLGIIRIPNYPFSKYTVPRMPESEVKAAGADIVATMINYTPKNGQEKLAKDVFLLSFYLIGMNTKDIYTCKAGLKDGRLTYKRSKTKDKRSDNAEISIKIEPELESLLNTYLNRDGINTFNFCNVYKSPKTMNTALFRGFDSIRKNLATELKEKDYELLKISKLTMYSARHSWATIASHNCNIIDSHIAKCLNHASIDFKVTNKYIKRDWSLIDKCNRQVIDFVNEKLKDKRGLSQTLCKL